MQLLFDTYVLPPLLHAAAGGKAVCQRTLRFFGLHETELENLLKGLCQCHEGLCVGYYPNFPENHLTLTVRAPSPRRWKRLWMSSPEIWRRRRAMPI